MTTITEMQRGAFHWRGGLFFKREPDGSVQIFRSANDTDIFVIASIPAPEWASVVCSVSREGETGERWDAAQMFHGKP